jgi:hypothetical protein
VYLQAAKAFKEAVAGFTLRIQQLAALWVRLLETLDHAGMLPTQIAGQTTGVPQAQAASGCARLGLWGQLSGWQAA